MVQWLAGSSMTWALAAVVGVVVMLAASAVFGLAGMRGDPLRRRLAALGKVETHGHNSRASGLRNVLRPLAPYLLPKKEKERETLRVKLLRAGMRSDIAAIGFYALKAVLGVVFPLVLVVWLVVERDLPWVYLPLFGFLAAFIGMMLPNAYLNARISTRHNEMLNALPDALDLLVSCTEAGLGLNGALQRVARQLGLSSPLLAQELEQVNAEIRGGVDRIVALKNLTERTGLDEIRGLVSLLSQSLRFGSPIAEILRIYADEFRDKRSQRAEEQAAMVGTKLIFPLCFCIFPSFFIIAVGPAVIGAIRALAASDF
ncbi:type II secretion system F family protein [Sinimarinibacterium sp. CAU 1509]|uniref:type II secretion system F family protein n=1 Tax=Sinimarinibacterium sp. CAU 1509 TaxID=2562283 RepID=UPI0010AC79C0|nr:type II secretion system F family protein [Sinimarinibacterium sp. CAU 1509]TJY65271.1 type II secretion system F family protein [Sinimarinibacterium sp. CAU 1509]